jgi:hypothetical protein
MISMLRRRLASCALALVVCQSALVFAAPLSSCCPSRDGAKAKAEQAEAEKDCCPAGSHPPGQCPRHAASKAAARISCRMQCDAPHGVEFLLGAVGLLPPLAVSLAAPLASSAPAVSEAAPETRPFVPDLQPPRLA